MITVKSTINLANQSVPNVIPVVQGDTGRSILFSLADFTIPEGATARYFVMKPSGLAVYNDATIDGNTVLVDLTAQSLAEYGDCPGQVRISVGDTVVTSFEFILHVEPFRGIDAVESTTETNIFDKAVEDAREAIAEAAEDAEEYISQAIDPTLTIEDKAADAKATGDAISDSADAVIAQMRAEIANVYPTETAQGNPATFDDGADGIPVKDLKVSIVPNQDLHGYDKPWAGGAGKNLLNVTATSQTVNEVTFTVNVDGTVTVNGTATGGNATFIVCSGSTALTPMVGKTVIINGNPGGGGMRLQWWNYDGTSSSMIDYGSGSSAFTPTVSTGNVAIIIENGTTVNNAVFKPMIRLASESDAAFEPYSNICPITGTEEVGVTVTGVNQWDEQWELGAINSTTGANQTSSNVIRSTGFIPVTPQTVYYCYKRTTAASSNFALFFYNADKTFITGSVQYKDSATFTTPSGARYMRFSMNTGYGTTYNNDISINLPSTDTDYHAYQGTSHTIPLDRTVYGGTLDVTTGVLTVDRASVDLGTLTYTLNSNTANRQAWSVTISDLKPCLDATTPAPIISTLFRNGSINDTWLPGMICYSSTVNRTYLVVCVQPSQYVDANAMKTAMSGVQLVYELATPHTYQLTPQEVMSVLGTNHISTDAESVEVEYRADIKLYIEQLTEPDADMIADMNITSGNYFMVGNALYLATANIANGADIVPGVNCTRTSLAEALNTINA